MDEEAGTPVSEITTPFSCSLTIAIPDPAWVLLISSVAYPAVTELVFPVQNHSAHWFSGTLRLTLGEVVFGPVLCGVPVVAVTLFAEFPVVGPEANSNAPTSGAVPEYGQAELASLKLARTTP